MEEPLYMPEGALPPAEVRIESLRAEPYPEGRRVRVLIVLTPFQKRPNLVVRIIDADGEEAAIVNVIEAMTHRMTFTMHLRGPINSSKFTLSVALQYEDLGTVHESSIPFDIIPEADGV